MAFGKWSVWSFILRYLAKAQGFLDPMVVFSNLQRFSKPSQVWVPTELLRSGAVLQARGLINSQAIQHNLDWIWPMWVEQQFNPRQRGFIPRAFSMTHINLTHRNWTAVGIPDFPEYSLVDPHGLVTPFFDGWSLDAWIIREHDCLIPSRLLDEVQQHLEVNGTLAVVTQTHIDNMGLHTKVLVEKDGAWPRCTMVVRASSNRRAWLAICPRPYNPEGVSFIRSIKQGLETPGWTINDRHKIILKEKPDQYLLSNYEQGDVYGRIRFCPADQQLVPSAPSAIACGVGMATAAALFEIKPYNAREITVEVPLQDAKQEQHPMVVSDWHTHLDTSAALQIPHPHFQFLYEAALRTLVLHSPGDVFPGPFTYKRFWFRDAAFIINAMITTGLLRNVEKILDLFPSRQTPTGYFESQDGEWDSNGQAIWIMQRYAAMTNRPLKDEWRHSIVRAGKWISRKRLPKNKDDIHSGLLPAGFSAEHFGPSDFYYWDDFWAVAGLKRAAEAAAIDDPQEAAALRTEAQDLMGCIEESLQRTHERLGGVMVPAAPSRRMDGGAVGSLAASYPLQLWGAHDKRILETVHFLTNRYLYDGGFYHEISHSGINAYLSLHIAQVMLRAGDMRFFDIVKSVAAFASPTGQWPEAIHPRTKGGCMGDGQHVWAAAEWVLMMRNMFIREEEQSRTLVLCSGIPAGWLKNHTVLSLGPVLTVFGRISLTIKIEDGIHISWDAQWYGNPPSIEIHLDEHGKHKVEPGALDFQLTYNHFMGGAV